MEKVKNVVLSRLEAEDREQFILDNQEAFRFGAMEEFGLRDGHFEEEGEIISRATIEECLDRERTEAYRIVLDGKTVGGTVLEIDPTTQINHLELLFISPSEHSRGIGQAAWRAIESLYPETRVWVTGTPYFEKRNIHFYVNKCGFHITKFYNRFMPEPGEAAGGQTDGENDGFFEFEKVMKA